jgi:hypothetical protein
MLAIKYDPEHGIICHDANVMQTALNIYNRYSKAEELISDDSKTVYTVGMELIIECFRILVLREVIPYNDIEFLFYDKENDQEILILIDKFGNCDYWPKGFCDYRDNLIDEHLSTKYPLEDE